MPGHMEELGNEEIRVPQSVRDATTRSVGVHGSWVGRPLRIAARNARLWFSNLNLSLTQLTSGSQQSVTTETLTSHAL